MAHARGEMDPMSASPHRLPRTFSRVGLGTSRLASLGSRISFKEAERLLHVSREHGVTLIDTSNAYGSGDSERLVGKIVARNRADYFIVTKAGLPQVSLHAALSPLNQLGKKLLQ